MPRRLPPIASGKDGKSLFAVPFREAGLVAEVSRVDSANAEKSSEQSPETRFRNELKQKTMKILGFFLKPSFARLRPLDGAPAVVVE